MGKQDSNNNKNLIDVYFSADVETDGPIPGPYSMLSFALVYAGRFDGKEFDRPKSLSETYYCELKPISDQYESEALLLNKLDRDMLKEKGKDPVKAMTLASKWVRKIANGNRPVLVESYNTIVFARAACLFK